MQSDQDQLPNNAEERRDSVADDEETEDEEIKLTCVGGSQRILGDSDFSSSDSDVGIEEEQDDDDEMVQEPQRDGLVQFSAGRPSESSHSGIPILRPHAERLSSNNDEDSASDDASSEVSAEASSVNARGLAMSLGGSTNGDASGNDYEDGDDEQDNEDGEASALSLEDDIDEEDEEEADSEQEPSILPQPSILQQLETANAKGQIKIDRCKAKRVLSSNTLAALNAEAGRKVASPKRMRTSPDSISKTILVADSEPMERLPDLNMGILAINDRIIRPLPGFGLMRGNSPAISSDDDEELDRALSEELKRSGSKIDLSGGGDSSPVPLLTPPQSPLTLPTADGSGLEWPSNLVVDSAMMTAATTTRPLSPASLQKFEEDEEVRLKDAYSHPDPTTLTPLLRSIYVGIR